MQRENAVFPLPTGVVYYTHTHLARAASAYESNIMEP